MPEEEDEPSNEEMAKILFRYRRSDPRAKLALDRFFAGRSAAKLAYRAHCARFGLKSILDKG